MKVITVSASKEYDVKIGSGLLGTLGAETAALCKGRKAAIITDSTVWPLYGDAAKCSLENAGFQTVSYVFPAGEASKNGMVYLEVLNFLAEKMLKAEKTGCN